MAKSKEQEKEIEEKHKKMMKMYYEEGKTPSEIAEMLGYSHPNCVTRQLKRMGKDRNQSKKALNEETIQYIIKRYKEDQISSGEIAKELGVNESTIHKKLKKNNIEIRGRAGQAKIEKIKREELPLTSEESDL